MNPGILARMREQISTNRGRVPRKNGLASSASEGEPDAVLTAEIPESLKRELKVRSALRGETIKQVVTRAIRREMAGWDS